MVDMIIPQKNINGSFTNPGGSGRKKNNCWNDQPHRGDGQEVAKKLREVKKNKDFLTSVAQLVNTYRNAKIELKKPESCKLIIGNLDDTIYWGRPDMLEAWEELYLPETMHMKVIGTIDNFPCLAPGLQLVVLVGEDFSVYIYENEVLHKAAASLSDLLDKGATLPGIEVYEYGSGLQPETAEEYLELMKEAGVEKISESTRDFVNSNSKEINEMLQFLADL